MLSISAKKIEVFSVTDLAIFVNFSPAAEKPAPTLIHFHIPDFTYVGIPNRIQKGTHGAFSIMGLG